MPRWDSLDIPLGMLKTWDRLRETSPELRRSIFRDFSLFYCLLWLGKGGAIGSVEGAFPVSAFAINGSLSLPLPLLFSPSWLAG